VGVGGVAEIGDFSLGGVCCGKEVGGGGGGDIRMINSCTEALK